MAKLTFPVSAAAALLLSAPAAAADVRVANLRVVYTAAAGETNHVEVTAIESTEDRWRVTLRDATAGLAPGDGCAVDADGKVVCIAPISGDIIMTVDLGDGHDTFSADRTCAGIQLCMEVDGGAGDDALVGSAGADLLAGGDGEDSLQGRRGVSYGYSPGDDIFGAASGDILKGGRGDDRLDGGREPDLLIGGAGADVLVGGGGYDTVSYAARRNPVHVDLRTAADDGAPLEGDFVGTEVEEVRGGHGSDRIVGNERRNTLDGGGGDDWILGLGGADFVIGDVGADVLRGGDGNDRLDATWVDPRDHAITTERRGRDLLFGGAGNDFLDSADATRDRLRGGDGLDSAHVDEGLDHIAGVERVSTTLAGRIGERRRRPPSR